MSASPLLHGSLDTLILKALNEGHRHGYGIARWIETESRNVVRIEEGSLYPALYRLEKRGLLEAEWGVSELNRRAKFYRLTSKGEARLAEGSAEWARFSRAVTRLLEPTGTRGSARKRHV